MRSLLPYTRAFPARVRGRAGEAGRYARLADGQSPEALFLTCSDSRVQPAVFTGALPGQLFELRTAGNVVPPYATGHPTAEAATIEYAVCVLEVPEIVVCGHSHCGAVGARARGDDLAAVPAVDGWLSSQLAPRAELAGDGAAPGGPDVAAAVQRHVRVQLARLRDYPCVAERQAAGRLGVRGWFYTVDTGQVHELDTRTDAFLPL
ncbi:carbonic anhydrase [Streptomyces reniochalinae]|uniref:Carbonic anhydrase n=1 Tax=Streptomyces reniochalinae TaxID=2250578 RepID=A0A367F5G6_9ACTN|nr:carbonic anhydrase [Streptomyces reniochalinae]RCG25189.1 carbonic anhydrase [Streptomyces reniochalinae]